MPDFYKAIIMVLCFSLQVRAQNLILNPSFEEYYRCPDQISQIEYCKHWYNKGGTPDFYHKCGFYKMENVKFEYTQDPYDGSGVCGIGISWPFRLRYDTIFKEYCMGTLSDPTTNGAYYFKVYILSNPENRTNHLGVYFTKDTIPEFNGYARNITPQLLFNEWIGSYPSWKMQAGCVEDIPGSRYFTIGNFQVAGTDSVEFRDIDFSNFIHLDALGLYKIPEYKMSDTTIVGSYCVSPGGTINEIPVFHTLNGDTIYEKTCIDAGKHTLKTYVKGCDKLIRELNIQIVQCNSIMVCSNITRKRNGAIELKCAIKESDILDIESLSLYVGGAI